MRRPKLRVTPKPQVALAVRAIVIHRVGRIVRRKYRAGVTASGIGRRRLRAEFLMDF